MFFPLDLDVVFLLSPDDFLTVFVLRPDVDLYVVLRLTLLEGECFTALLLRVVFLAGALYLFVEVVTFLLLLFVFETPLLETFSDVFL